MKLRAFICLIFRLNLKGPLLLIINLNFTCQTASDAPSCQEMFAALAAHGFRCKWRTAANFYCPNYEFRAPGGVTSVPWFKNKHGAWHVISSPVPLVSGLSRRTNAGAGPRRANVRATTCLWAARPRFRCVRWQVWPGRCSGTCLELRKRRGTRRLTGDRDLHSRH